MKAKILVLLFIGTLFAGSVSADLDFNIRENCNTNEEPIFSMYSKTGGNMAEPGYYKWQICGEGVQNAEIRDSCNQGEKSIISMFQKQDSHASITEEYNWDVCTPDFSTNLTQSCDNPIASMNSETDSHVAEPNYYKWQICPTFEEPKNVSLELKLDAENVYVDGDAAEERSYTPIELSYPYITSDQPIGLVNYGKIRQINYETQGSTDILTMTNDPASASVLIPHTNGGYQEIEDEEDFINERSFLNQNQPTFGFPAVGKPTVKVGKNFDHTIQGFEGVKNGRVELSIRNKVDNKGGVEIILTSLG